MLIETRREHAAATPAAGAASTGPDLERIRLTRLMERTGGSRHVAVAILDGPVAADHPQLAGARLRAVGEGAGALCTRTDSYACSHGTFVAGILAARRGSGAPAICPGCTFLVRPIFREGSRAGGIPSASPDDLADAIVESVAAGARVINLSAATGAPSTRSERVLDEALTFAARRGVLIVAAAGNQATLGSSAITRHSAVIPVVAIDRQGRPTADSNLGGSVGRRGLGAPGQGVASLHPGGALRSGGGTSAAAAFVTGAIALLWSSFPGATATELRNATTAGSGRRAVTPPLLDAEAAFATLSRSSRRS